MQYNPQQGQPYPQQQPMQHVHGGVPYGVPHPSQGGSGGSATKQPQPNQQGGKPSQDKKKRPPSFYVAIVIAVIAIVAAGVFAYMTFAEEQRPARNGNAILGQLDGKSEEEIKAELNRIIEEGMFNISIASFVEFEDGESEGDIRIENVPNNHYLMQVEITRNDNGDLIYSSDVLEPNYHIQTAKLDKDLPAGVYDCTATFHALDMDTEEEIGVAGAVITIKVNN